MSFLQLKVIVWKNLIIRKRHWILTVFESILPIVLFLLIAFGRSKINGLNKKEVLNVTYNEPSPILYHSIDVEETYLYYTPQDEFYQDIIKRLQVKLQMYNNNIKGFDSTEELKNYYYKHHDNKVIALIFKGDQKNLDYIIRYHEDSYSSFLHTTEKFKDKFLFTPGVGTDYEWKGFLSMQKALDMSFIEKIFGKDLENNITLFVEEFPYPPYKVDSDINSVFQTFLPLVTLFSFIFLCPALLKRVVEEKHSGIKELMKMVGMKSWMLWLGWFIYGIIPLLFSIIFIVILMKNSFFGVKYPPIEYCDGSILFVFLLLYSMAAITFCFAISSLFSKPTIAMVTGILIWILSYFIPKCLLELEHSNRLAWSLSILTNLLPNMALHFGYSAISSYEERELGIRWNNFYKSPSDGTNDITMLNVFIMLLLDMFLYTSFTFYMDGVNPGKYGVKKHLAFPIFSLVKFIKKYITKSDNETNNESVRLANIEKGDGLKEGIVIRNLSKRYDSKLAVDNLSLDIYQNQITVLLGHNGAGKSTTMSMLTGMVNYTSGSIKINGKNIKTDMNYIRQGLGLCPQHNLLFTDLTVGEHLKFFARLKGKSAKEAETETESILKTLNMSEKINSMANTLSGGMKRKLCLGMAIVGGSNILILDEPSSGMDPESRRELWDLLLSWRGSKTILITTHFMEEADALGDWIAIMSNGSLECYGTPLYLKKQYDTGYHLSLMVNGNATDKDKKELSKSIKNYIPEAQEKDSNGNNIIFVLPFEKRMKISTLLTFLEENKVKLNVENISVSVTTLEDVFLKANSKTNPENENSEIFDTALLESCESENRSLKSENLVYSRMGALFKKKCQFYRKNFISHAIPSTIALVLFLLTVYLSSAASGYLGSGGSLLKLQLDTYGETTVFYNGTSNEIIEKLKNYYNQVVQSNGGNPMNVEDVDQAIINKGIDNILYYKEHLIASAEFHYNSNREVEAIALYNAIAVHSSPISLNLITNALAKTYLGDGYSISISSWPLETVNSNTSKEEYSTIKVSLLWLIMIPIACLFIVGSFITFPHTEISTKFARMQYMCGVKPYYYWAVNFLADLTIYLIVVIFLALVTYLITPYFNFQEFGSLCIILFMYGLACIPFAYLFARTKSSAGGFSIFVIVGIFLGIILTVIVGVLRDSMDDYYIKVGKFLKVIFLVFLPQFGLTISCMDFAVKAIDNYNMEVMPKIKFDIKCSSEPNPCCYGFNTSECKDYKSYSSVLLENYLYMLLCFFIYFIVNISYDYYINNYWSSLKNILKFKWKRSTAISNGEHSQNTLKVNNLQKNYGSKRIVDNIEFTLNNGECLGILGVNGAGKTTTFRMLTREENVDGGDIKIADENGVINIKRDEYLEKLGYCPQSDALNFSLTGREILSLIAQLRGIKDTKNTVDAFLKTFELEKYADQPCGHYSGGNKRKLSLAVALIGFPKYVLLDEPTNGVDPSSRRKFWTIIKKFQEKKNISFILTSHSMVECEALCNTLKIMKAGKFEKTGTIRDLKKEYGGFTVKLKLKTKNNNMKQLQHNEIEYDEVDSAPLIQEEQTPVFETLEDLKEYFTQTYGGEIKDQHSGLLHLYISDKNKRWSTIFRELEAIKEKNPDLIEDYAISEASLEDIFLSVARSDDGEEGNKKKNKKKKKKREHNTV